MIACVRRTPANKRALKGTKGLIVGNVERFDERKHVFARNRTLIPGSDPYKSFYQAYPELEAGHKYAIVFAEEMDFEMIGSAPHTPTVMESMGAYARGAFIAAQLANFVANMVYSATTNQLRYYEALLVPLAVDAGLGESGRLGYLLTKQYGPRVRIGAVTTNLPLVPDNPIDIGVEDFCRICKKCAVCCPSDSVPLDDIFYGKRPKPRPAPEWAQFKALNRQ